MTSSPGAEPSSGAPAILRARTRTPRVLYLSPYFPHRATTASELRSVNIGRALQQFGNVEVIVVGGEGADEEWKLRTERQFAVAYALPVHVQPPKRLREKVRWALDPRVNYPHGCGVDEGSLQRVLRTAADFDIIWFFKLRTPNMFPRWAWPRSVADIDDVPSTFVQSILETELSAAERLRSRMQLWSWKRRDRLLGDRFTVLGVCSKADKRYLEALGVRAPVHVIPNGSDMPAATPVRRPATPPRIGFIGIFDYEPNREGVEWFVARCWPEIKRELPDVRLRLVGRLSDGPLKPPGPDIDGLGFVPDPADEIATWSAMIVPVRTGAGTRVKIAHGFSQKCPIVATSLGAHGYEARDGDTMRLADSPDGFARACLQIVRQPDAATAMAERAWQEFLEKWTWDAVRPRVYAAAEDCLRRAAALTQT
jgi:polysaccharide biosynthesis protein PslH